MLVDTVPNKTPDERSRPLDHLHRRYGKPDASEAAAWLLQRPCWLQALSSGSKSKRLSIRDGIRPHS